MTQMPHIPHHASVAQARETLAQAGWREDGVGDWSWVMADPRDRLAVRLTPFGPAYRLHAEAILAGPVNRWLPRVYGLTPLAGDGYAVVMERLWPADEARAEAFCGALGVRNDSGYHLREGLAFEDADADLEALRERVLALSAEGARRYRLWGGSDVRPGNVMADAGGGLKLVDPIFLRGLGVVEAIQEGRRDLLADFTRGQLQAFLTIPPFKPGAETDAMAARLASLYD